MKDLHTKLDNGEAMILEELCKKYDCTKTDIISSLLELANNSILNEIHIQWCLMNDEESAKFHDTFQYFMLAAITNRQ